MEILLEKYLQQQPYDRFRKLSYTKI